VTLFFDTYVQFGLQFEPPPEAEPAVVETAETGDDDETPPPDDGPKVVSLDQFRKK
jgi:hypothetical protein